MVFHLLKRNDSLFMFCFLFLLKLFNSFIFLPRKKATPYVALEIPKPSHSLDLNLFEPESPEVEPYFHDEEEEEEQAPLVVVEPSRGMEDELLTKFKEQNFKDVTEWYLRCYTGDRKCAMLAKLMHLIKTNPIYNVEDNNQQMSPGHIVFKILHSAFVDEEGRVYTTTIIKKGS